MQRTWFAHNIVKVSFLVTVHHTASYWNIQLLTADRDYIISCNIANGLSFKCQSTEAFDGPCGNCVVKGLDLISLEYQLITSCWPNMIVRMGEEVPLEVSHVM